jgi:hypothetical protein
MSATAIQAMAERVAGLMEDRLKVRGKGLAEKVRAGGRLLPRRVRSAANVLAQAADQARNPRLVPQIDMDAVSRAYDTCVRHLTPLGRRDRILGLAVGVAASVALAVLVVAVGFVGVLYWRGYL